MLLALRLRLRGPARAQAYPTRAIRLVVPFPPGGVMDMAARVIGSEMARDLKQPLTVDNRGGAGGNVGAEIVARAPADGYTLLYGIGSAFTANPHLYSSLPFDPLKDFVPITETVAGGMVLLVRPEFAARNLKDWVAYVQSRPGVLTYASYGNGSFPHLNMELLKSLTNTHLVHIPYRGAAPALQDLLAGRIDMMFDQSATAIPQVRSRRLRAIAVNTPGPMPALPGVPPIAESLPGFDGSGWQGLWAPAGTPPEVLLRIHQSAVKALGLPGVRKFFVDAGLDVVGSTPDEVRAKIVRESGRWREVIRSAHIRID
jgi:tripartite-type tricarboxylate transporter receptor subunit TctC